MVVGCHLPGVRGNGQIKTEERSIATFANLDASGAFTLARPEDGWMPGDYRVEFYVDGVLVDAVKMKILQ